MELIASISDVFHTGFIALTLAIARLIAIMQIFPLFSWTKIQGGIRSAAAIGISIPVTVMIYQQLKANPIDNYFTIAMLGAKEAAVGFVIGVILGLPFYAAQAAGDIVDSYRGASMANLSDPVNAQETTVMGTLIILLTLALFVVSNGFILLIEIWFETYTAWPVLSMKPAANFEVSASVGLGLMAIFKVAIVIGGPLLIFLALVDVGLVFSGRSSKQFNLYDLSNALRNFVLMLILPVYFYFFVAFYTDEARRYFEILRTFVTGGKGQL